MKAGKIWGNTELIEANGALEFHRIEMEEGGVCSFGTRTSSSGHKVPEIVGQTK